VVEAKLFSPAWLASFDAETLKKYLVAALNPVAVYDVPGVVPIDESVALSVP
jgi:hypothetical protein